MKIKMSIYFIVTILLFTGCSSAGGETIIPNNTSEVENSSNKEKEQKYFTEIGEVTKVIGNEITMKMIKKSEKSTETTNSDKEKIGKQAFPGGGPTGRKSTVEYTGEVVTFIIPVGTPIFTRTGKNLEEVELEEIISGVKLNLSYKYKELEKEIPDRIINKIILMK